MTVTLPVGAPETAEGKPLQDAPPGPAPRNRPMGAFTWDDALLLDDQLTGDERANRHERFDREMGGIGFLGATLEGYGCAGIGGVTYAVILGRAQTGLSAFG